MYRIIIYNPDGTQSTLYAPAGTGILPVLGPRSTEELNEPGSLEFSLVYGHPAYDLIEPKKTYISADLNGTEFFYGRVLNADPSPMSGQTQYTAAGALSFLKDSEVPPDPKKSDGTTDYQTMTAEAFFRRCIAAHNAVVGSDTRRQFTVGIVSHSRKDETRQYQLTSYQDTRSVLEQNLLENYGGFLRTRRANGVLYIDWVETYGDTDAGELALGQNIISLLNRMAADELYTAIRPIGKDGITLSGNNGLIYLYPGEQMAEYGVIVRSVTFNDADTQASLQTKAVALVNRLQKSLVISSEIKLLDMKFVDGLFHGVNLGDVFTQIAGLEGKPMIVGARNRDFENPQNDSCTLRNPKSYEGGSNPESNASTLSQKTSRNSAAGGYAYKYIHEFNERLELNTKNIAINAEELELHAETLVETANEFRRISHTEGLMDDRLNAIEGTGVIQNSEAITNVAGKFRVVTDPDTGESTVDLLAGATLRIEKNGIYSDVVNEDQMHSSIEQTADAISMSVADATTDLYSTIRVTATNVYSEVWNRTSSTFSTIEQTSEMVRTEVGTAVSGIAHSVIEQTATYIHMEVANAASSITESVIEQTSDYVRTTVGDVASRIAWSVVEQTMTGIIQEVGRKATVYRQPNDPNNGVNVLMTGDIWIKATKKTWNEMAQKTWNNIAQEKWKDYYANVTYVWDGTKWNVMYDEAPVVESKTWVEQSSERYAILARQVDTNGEATESNLSVTAHKISTEVNAANSNLYSTIAQTATNITARVENVREGLQSNIEQTAQSITTSVSAAHSRLYSTIEQTATSIRSEVANTVSDLRSSIEQTAESVTIAVTAAKSDMGSLIKSTATNIYSAVWNRTADTYSTIEQTADKIQAAVSASEGTLKSLIRVTATNVYSSVWDKTAETYSTFEQTATSIRTMVVDENIGNYSTILQTSTSIALSVASAKSEVQSSIKTQADRISLVVEGTGTNAKIRPAQIVASINDSGSNIRLNADKVSITGATTINSVFEVTDNQVKVKKPAVFNGSVFLTNTSAIVSAYTFEISGPTASSYYRLDNSTLGSMIKTATVSGNTLKLTKFDNTEITFSKATTLAGNWNGGTFEVEASPQGNTITTQIFDLTSSDISWNNNTATISLYANKNGGETKLYTGKQLTLDASERYIAGNRAVTVNSLVTWNTYSGSTPPSVRTATVYTSGRVKTDGTGSDEATRTMQFTLSQGNWSSGSKTVSMVYGGENRAQTTVSIPDITSFNTWAADPSEPANRAAYDIANIPYNNSSGYSISGSGASAIVRIIIRGKPTIGGVQKTSYDYLEGAPSNIYHDGYSAGYSSGDTAGRKTGWDLARGKCSEDGSTSTSYLLIRKPGSSYNSQTPVYYYLSVDDDYAYIKNSDQTIRARVENTAWASGYDWTSSTYPNHGLITVHSGHAAVTSGSVGVNGSYAIWPAFKKYAARNKAASDLVDSDFMWGPKMTVSGPSMTQYGLLCSGRTQDTSGNYHYTFAVSTGKTTPFSVNTTYQFYKY